MVPASIVDLVGNHEVVRRLVQARVDGEGLAARIYPDYAALLNSVREDTSPSARWLVVCPAEADEIPEGFLRSVSRETGRTRCVVFAPGLREDQARSMVLDGASSVHGIPLPVTPVREWFDLDSYLQTVYPGALDCERTEIHRLRLPSERSWVAPTIRHLCERLDGLGHPDDLVRSVFPLVVDESVTNAMQHGNRWNPRRMVTVEATLSPHGFRLEVQDEGGGFDRSAVRDPLRRENLRREGGRGIFLMESLVDEVRYEEGGRKVVICGGEFAGCGTASV